MARKFHIPREYLAAYEKNLSKGEPKFVSFENKLNAPNGFTSQEQVNQIVPTLFEKEEQEKLQVRNMMKGDVVSQNESVLFDSLNKDDMPKEEFEDLFFDSLNDITKEDVFEATDSGDMYDDTTLTLLVEKGVINRFEKDYLDNNYWRGISKEELNLLNNEEILPILKELTETWSNVDFDNSFSKGGITIQYNGDGSWSILEKNIPMDTSYNLKEIVEKAEEEVKYFESNFSKQTSQKEIIEGNHNISLDSDINEDFIVLNNNEIRQNGNDGSFTIDGKKKSEEELSDTYSTSFFRSETKQLFKNEPELYRELKTELRKFTNSDMQMGIFAGEGEISYPVKDLNKALFIMMQTNQNSVWDNKKGDLIENPLFDRNKKLTLKDYKSFINSLKSINNGNLTRLNERNNYLLNFIKDSNLREKINNELKENKMITFNQFIKENQIEPLSSIGKDRWKEKTKQNIAKMPGVAKHTVFIDIDKLIPVKEFDRFSVGHFGSYRATESQAVDLINDIKQNGIKDPITLTYNPKNSYAAITEGNHRLEILKMLGIDKVPVFINADTDLDPFEDRISVNSGTFIKTLDGSRLNDDSFKNNNFYPQRSKILEQTRVNKQYNNQKSYILRAANNQRKEEKEKMRYNNLTEEEKKQEEQEFKEISKLFKNL